MVIWRILKQDKTAFTGFFIIVGLIIIAILAPWIAPYDFSAQHIIHAFKGPTKSFLLGTDEFGRDLLSRMIWGTRPALLVGVLSVTVSIGIGVPIGLWAGFKLGWVDRVVSCISMLASVGVLVVGVVTVHVRLADLANQHGPHLHSRFRCGLNVGVLALN